MNPEVYAVPLHWLGELCALAAICGVIHLTVASILILRISAKRRQQTAEHFPPISILVPLCGEDPGLYDRLAALCRQDYAGPVQLVCGVQNADDPAIGIVKAVARDFPNQPIDLQLDAKQHGCNRKISNLINMSRLARHNLFVIVDSDIMVGASYLSDIAEALRTPGAGAVSCLYHGISGVGRWSTFSSLSINTHFLPGVVTALKFHFARPCFGATIALSRSMLATIGGFHAFADCLHDDYAIGASVHAAGYSVVIPEFSIGHVCRERTARELLLNQMRYARTIKMIDPVGYAGSVVTHPVALALIALMLGSSHGVALLLLAVGSRIVVCLCVEQAFGLAHQPCWLLPLRDLLSFGIYVTSFFGARVSWRGERYRLNADGTLVQDSE